MQALCWAQPGSAERRTGEGMIFCSSDHGADFATVRYDADVQIVVSEFLSTIDHQVISASSAKQARHAPADTAVNIAVIDCLMIRG